MEDATPLNSADAKNFASTIQTEIKAILQADYPVILAEDTEDILPEYVSVMISNQKSRGQVIEALQDFFQDRSEEFVNWLWAHLAQLNPSQPTMDMDLRNGSAEDGAGTSGVHKRKAETSHSLYPSSRGLTQALRQAHSSVLDPSSAPRGVDPVNETEKDDSGRDRDRRRLRVRGTRTGDAHPPGDGNNDGWFNSERRGLVPATPHVDSSISRHGRPSGGRSSAGGGGGRLGGGRLAGGRLHQSRGAEPGGYDSGRGRHTDSIMGLSQVPLRQPGPALRTHMDQAQIGSADLEAQMAALEAQKLALQRQMQAGAQGPRLDVSVAPLADRETIVSALKGDAHRQSALFTITMHGVDPSLMEPVSDEVDVPAFHDEYTDGRAGDDGQNGNYGSSHFRPGRWGGGGQRYQSAARVPPPPSSTTPATWVQPAFKRYKPGENQWVSSEYKGIELAKKINSALPDTVPEGGRLKSANKTWKAAGAVPVQSNQAVFDVDEDE